LGKKGRELSLQVKPIFKNNSRPDGGKNKNYINSVALIAKASLTPSSIMNARAASTWETSVSTSA